MDFFGIEQEEDGSNEFKHTKGFGKGKNENGATEATPLINFKTY
jgi:hypothetical protein